MSNNSRARRSQEVPLFYMRGGTSTGVVLNKSDLPDNNKERDDLLRKIMGVPQAETVYPNQSQITGLGRGSPTSNKLFILEVIDKERRIIKSTLAQFAAGKSSIDWSVNCGNMSSAIPLYLVENKLVNLSDGSNRIEIHNTNTGKSSYAYIKTQGNQIVDFATIPGVSGLYPAVTLELDDPVGAKTGKLFPTGNKRDIIDGIEVSCVDVNVPMVIAYAKDLGKSAYESLEELNADTNLMTRLRKIWTLAGIKMKLSDTQGELLTKEQLENSETMPKICLISPSRNGQDINTRYFTPQKPHDSLAVSGGGCLAAACVLKGTIAHELMTEQIVRDLTQKTQVINIENPAGVLDIELIMEKENIKKILYKRNAQILVKGTSVIYS